MQFQHIPTALNPHSEQPHAARDQREWCTTPPPSLPLIPRVNLVQFWNMCVYVKHLALPNSKRVCVQRTDVMWCGVPIRINQSRTSESNWIKKTQLRSWENAVPLLYTHNIHHQEHLWFVMVRSVCGCYFRLLGRTIIIHIRLARCVAACLVDYLYTIWCGRNTKNTVVNLSTTIWERYTCIGATRRCVEGLLRTANRWFTAGECL